MDISRIVDQSSSDDKRREHHPKATAAINGSSASLKSPYPPLAPPPVYSSHHHSQTPLAPLAILNSPGGLVPPPSYPQLPPVSSLHGHPSTNSYAHDSHVGQSMPPPYGHVMQSLYAGGVGSAPQPAYVHHPLPALNHSTSITGRPGGLKRTASQANIHVSHESPPKKMGKWTPEEDALAIELRRKGMKWEDISKRLPGRSAISCRLRYQNYSEKRPDWDEEKKNKLARLYNRFKKDMWDMIAKEMALPWRAVESMHWQMGCEDMAIRANVPVFQPRTQASTKAQASLSGKCKKSPSPSKHLEDNHGLSYEARLSCTNSTSPEPLTASRRSSSVVSPQRQEHKVKREYDYTRKSLLLAAMDEPDVTRSLFKQGSRRSQESTSEHEWGEHDREGTGTSQTSQSSQNSENLQNLPNLQNLQSLPYSPRSPHSPRSHGHNGSIGSRQSVRSVNPIMA